MSMFSFAILPTNILHLRLVNLVKPSEKKTFNYYKLLYRDVSIEMQLCMSYCYLLFLPTPLFSLCSHSNGLFWLLSLRLSVGFTFIYLQRQCDLSHSHTRIFCFEFLCMLLIRQSAHCAICWNVHFPERPNKGAQRQLLNRKILANMTHINLLSLPFFISIYIFIFIYFWRPLVVVINVAQLPKCQFSANFYSFPLPFR